jgi:phage terminase small subunit
MSKAPSKKTPKNIIDYIRSPDDWDAKIFETKIRSEIEASTGALTASDETLLGMLVMTMESLIASERTIKAQGHIEHYNSGPATSPYYKIRVESLDKAIKILAELGLVARGRPKKTSVPSAVDELFNTA